MKLEPLGWVVVVILTLALFGGLLIGLEKADRACSTVQHETGKTCP